MDCYSLLYLHQNMSLTYQVEYLIRKDRYRNTVRICKNRTQMVVLWTLFCPEVPEVPTQSLLG